MGDAFQFDLMRIGSGPAGPRAAVQAPKLGKRAAAVERRRIVSGVCLDTGTTVSRCQMQRTGHSLLGNRSSQGFGLFGVTWRIYKPRDPDNAIASSFLWKEGAHARWVANLWTALRGGVRG